MLICMLSALKEGQKNLERQSFPSPTSPLLMSLLSRHVFYRVAPVLLILSAIWLPSPSPPRFPRGPPPSPTVPSGSPSPPPPPQEYRSHLWKWRIHVPLEQNNKDLHTYIHKLTPSLIFSMFVSVCLSVCPSLNSHRAEKNLSINQLVLCNIWKAYY
jgi:hypothetical protein